MDDTQPKVSPQPEWQPSSSRQAPRSGVADDGPTAGNESGPRGDADGADAAATFCATLVDEWRRLGLTDAVVSPGSRSTPMALALAESSDVKVHVVLDERSAAFVALGLGIITRRPAALLCTSGTAAVNFHPAVVEAHQANVPMLVLTADRPPELQGVGAPQTIDQRHLYGSAIRWYCEPGPADAEGALGWRDLARDGWSRSMGSRPGPVHLNLAFREPLLGSPGALPPVAGTSTAVADGLSAGATWGLLDEELGRWVSALSAKRGMIVAGARCALDEADIDAVFGLAGQLGWPVLADGPSGCRRAHPAVVTSADLLLRDATVAEHLRPEVVVRIGGLHSSRVLREWLAGSGALQFGVDRFGTVPDPERVLSWSRPADPAEVCRQLVSAGTVAAPREWSAAWAAAEGSARGALAEAFGPGGQVTEPSTAVDVLGAVPAGGCLVASSSMPVRDLEWFAPPRDDVRIVSNRGANGIDGVISTALGIALTWVPTVLLTGDLAFLHDAGALVGIARRGVNLTVVVVDNDGGGIFGFLPQADRLDPDRFEQLFGTPHGMDLVAVADGYGVPAERVSSRAGLQAALNGAAMRGGPRVVVVQSDRAEVVGVHERLRSEVAAAARAALGVCEAGPSAGS